MNVKPKFYCIPVGIARREKDPKALEQEDLMCLL